MTTKYPNSIDTNTEIPLSTDNVTPVRAIVTNTLRGAILATEAELGVQPSGTFATVRARLDDLDSRISALSFGGGSGTLEIQSDGSTVLSAASILNFINTSIVQSSPGVAEITILGGGGDPVQETISTTNGQTSFTISQSPSESNTVMMFVNGEKQTYTTDFTVSGTSVTWNNTFTLASSDTVDFWYLVTSGGGGGGGEIGTLAEVLVQGNTSGGTSLTLSSGDNLILSTTSHIQSQGTLIEFDDSISVSGNATISGIIDGLNGTRLDAQGSIPIAVAAGKSVLWQRSGDKKLIFTDDTSTNWVLNPASSTWSSILSSGADSGSTSPRITSSATLLFQQRAAGIGALVGHGSLWTKNTSPTKLFFTDSDGTDFDLTDTSGSTLTAPTNPTDNNRIAFGTGGDLDYAASLLTDGTYLGIGSGTLPTSGDIRTPSGFIWKTRTSGGITRNLFDYGATNVDFLTIGHSSYDLSLNASEIINVKVDLSLAAVFDSDTAASLSLASPGYVLALNDDASALTYKFLSGVGTFPSLTNILNSGNTTDGYDIILSIGDAIRSEDGYVTINDGMILNGILDMNSNRITEVLSPVLGTDAVNKNYVDVSAPRPLTPHDDGYYLKSVLGVATWYPVIEGGGTPGGSAGGDLGGTYPNPTVTDLTISGETQGSILYFNGTNWVRLSPSNDGYYLQTHNTGANPTWAPPTRNTLGVLPADVTKSPALSGSSVFAAKEDHKHNISTAAASSVGVSNTEGSASSLARSDHTHAVIDLSISSQNQGDFLYFNGSNWVRLAAGPDGYFLETHGVGQNPTWADVTTTGGSPTGSAGGDLSGTYPNPTVHDLTITSEAQGDVLYFNGTNWVRLAAGTDGYYLTTHSVSQNPTWLSSTGVTSLNGASNTLNINHKNNALTVEHTSATSLIVPPNSSVPFPLGTIISVTPIGAGQITLTPGSGVTLNSAETLKSSRTFGTMWLRKTHTDVWMVSGDIQKRGMQLHPATANTRLLLQLNGVLTDSSGLGHTASVAAGTIVYSDVLPGAPKFAWFDAATALSVTHADVQIIGDITIQAIMVLDAGPNGNPWFSHGTTGETEATNIIYEAQIETGRLLSWFSESGVGVNSAFSWAGDGLPPVHQIFHITHRRQSGTISNWINGRQLGASQALTAPTGGGSGTLWIGGTVVGPAFISQIFLSSFRINAEARTDQQIADDYNYCLGGIYGDYFP